MRIDLFTLCDGVFNYNGKLTIVGAIDGYHVHSFPARETVNIAMKFVADPAEAVDEKLFFKIIDPQHNDLPACVICDIKLEPINEISHLSLAATIQGIEFKQEGEHQLCVYLGRNKLSSFSFYVKLRRLS